METNKLRTNVIMCAAEEFGELGKTAMMKVMYLLQQIYNFPLDYEFKIYTYGPYDDDVLMSIDDAERNGFIAIQKYNTPSGLTGYKIHPLENLKNSLSMEYRKIISGLYEIFKGYSARDWELAATIVFIHSAYKRNNIKPDNALICERVNCLKPHFNKSEIQAELDKLQNRNLINMAV